MLSELAAEREKARHFAENVVGAVRENDVGADACDLAPESAARERPRIGHLARDRAKLVVFPGLDEMRHQRRVVTERIAEKRGSGAEVAKLSTWNDAGSASRSAHTSTSCCTRFCSKSLRPCEELMPRVHLERSVDVQHQRFLLHAIQERSIAGRSDHCLHRWLEHGRRRLVMPGIPECMHGSMGGIG